MDWSRDAQLRGNDKESFVDEYLRKDGLARHVEVASEFTRGEDFIDKCPIHLTYS